ncbi:cytochrome c biogenesis CcdA family protein [Candidatus Rariloculus sp.]|uniref:cytochrome c biogenesis CcdA family protein n=1 Tax=Candidatus Rariloculus sp. TaxID=3101265 RepID=UPI003D11CB94
MHTIALRNPLKLSALVVIGVLIASSWLIVPYYVQGTQLLRSVGDNSRMIKGAGVSRYLTRSLVRSPQLEIAATYASSEYFQFVDRAAVIGNLRPDLNHVFFVSETIHRGELGTALPGVELHVGDESFAPRESSGPVNPEHHRVSVFSFPKRGANGSVIDIEDAGRMRLHVSDNYLGSERPLTFVGIWDAPYTVPDDLRASAGITPVAVLALGAGLLASVLTPCLLQLVVMFGSSIAAFSTLPGAPAAQSRNVTPYIRRKIMTVAGAFVLGFMALYMVAGALIGAAGYRAQLMFAEYSRTVAVVSGIIVILMGLWVGLRSSRAQACRIPTAANLRTLSRRDTIGTLVVSIGFALGCTACFGGAIVGTLLVYVGAIGSAPIGAGVMLAFGAGVAIPFMLAAWYVSSMDSILAFIGNHSKALNLASMVVIVIFGLILVTDNFHVVSDMIYPYLGLS